MTTDTRPPDRTVSECELCAAFLRDLSNAANEAERRGIKEALRMHQAAPHRVWKPARVGPGDDTDGGEQ